MIHHSSMLPPQRGGIYLLFRHFKKKFCYFYILFASIVLSACASNDDDGSLIGTGNGILDAGGLPAYQLLTESTPATQLQNPNGVMNFAPIGSLAGICPPLLVASEVMAEESNTEWNSPAAGFLGNWRGTTSEGDELILLISLDDVAHGNRTATLSLRSNPELSTSSIESLPSAFSYSVEIVSESQSVEPGTFTERYELVGADSLIYTIENEQIGNDTIQLNRIDAAELFRPPAWLQGEWANECESRSISDSTIVAISEVDAFDIATMLTGESSAFRVNSVNDRTYRYTAIYRNEDGDFLRISEDYELLDSAIRIVSGSTSKELDRN